MLGFLGFDRREAVRRGRQLAAQQEIRIRRGLDIALPGRPRQALRAAGKVRTVAVSGHDFPGVRPDFRVAVGDRVRAGQTLFIDRRRPDIAFTAPVAGVVTAIDRGRRRSLDALVIRMDGDEAEVFSTPAAGEPEGIRALLLKSGLWPSFLSRPFGRIPDPDAAPDAIFVAATDTNPLAADPRVAIGLHGESFRKGVEALLALTEGRVFVCHAPGPPPYDGGAARVRPVAVSGPHPAGLPGTHIHRLAPAGEGRTVWQIGCQDVIAIGHLLATGTLLPERVVAIAGSGVRDPALALLPQGASLDEALDGELAPGPARVISGSVLSGREAGYLGRYHNQVTVIAEDGVKGTGLLGRLVAVLAGAPGDAIVPQERFEAVMPLDILPVPLLRALAVGDVETAKDLGCLELLEEDMALLSHVCASGTDYGALLRDALDQLAEDG